MGFKCPAHSACSPILLGLFLPVLLVHGGKDASERKLGSVFNAGREFDCQAGVSHWKEWWSPIKADWCCKHHGVACAKDTEDRDITVDSGSGGTSSSSVSSRTTIAATTLEVTTVATTTPETTEATTMTTTTLETTEVTTRATTAPQTTPQETTRASTTLETAEVTTTAASKSQASEDRVEEEWWFDCEANLSEWQDSWSADKTGWCCRWWHRQQKWPGDGQQKVCCNSHHMMCAPAAPVAGGLPMLPVVMPGQPAKKFEKVTRSIFARVTSLGPAGRWWAPMGIALLALSALAVCGIIVKRAQRTRGPTYTLLSPSVREHVPVHSSL